MTTIDIILFCYKQEQYIEQALLSIYDQQVPADSSVRIIVADDCSPDNTLALIKKHAAESPFPMVFLPKEPNMGISKNYKRSFAATTADYVFILEGDDYWLPGHVMQHINFLQGHLDYSMCMNSITFYYEEKGEKRGGWWPYETEYLTVNLRQQIEDGNQLGNLSACCFRGQYLRDIPTKIFEIPVVDWMFGALMAQRGLIGILREITSVYLIKSSGVWAGKSIWQQTKGLLVCAKMYDNIQDGQYHAMWKNCRKNVLKYAFKHWTKFLPQKVQDLIHKVKGKKK